MPAEFNPMIESFHSTQQQADVLKAILSASVDHLYVLDQLGRYQYVSQGGASVLGYEPDALIGKTWKDLNLPAAVMEPVDAQRQAVMSSGQPIKAETEFPGTEGSTYYEYILTPWYDTDHSIQGVIVISRDVTERKQAEQQQQAQQQQLKIALQTAKLGAWELDLRTQTLICSDSCKANFGLPPDAEFTHETLFAALHPEDRDRVQAAIHHAITHRTDYEVEERCFWSDGSLHWLIARGRLIYDADGTPIKMVGVTLDITERKQIEESLRAAHQQLASILESITDAFIALDREWRYTYINQQAAQLLGRSPATLLGEPWQHSFSDATQNPAFMANLEFAMQQQSPIRFETHSSISQGWLEVSAFPFANGLAVSLQDISERKQTQAELQESEARYRAIFDQVLVGIAQSDQTGHFLQVNDRFCEIVGRSPAELLTLRMQDITHPEDLSRNLTLFHHLIAQGEPFEIEKRYIRPDGSDVWVRNYVSLIQDVAGHSQFATAITEDITAQRQAEAALRESQDLFQSFMRNSPTTAYIKDEAGRLIYGNKRLEQLLNCPVATFIGKTDFDFFPAEVAQILQANDRAVLDQDQAVSILETVPHADGNRHYMSFKFPLLNATGQRFLAGMSIDISDRIQAEAALRESEDRYRTLANAVPQLIWTNAPDGKLQFFNQQWQRYTGNHTPINAEMWFDFIHPEDLPSALQQRSQAIQAGTAYEVEFRLKRFDQTYRWHLVRVVPLQDEQGQILQWLGTATDIHDVKQAEAALRHSEALAKLSESIASARAEELETFMETVPAAVWIAHDPQCHEMTANQAAYQLLQLPSGAVATATPADGDYPFPFKIQRQGQDVPLQDLPMQKAGRIGQELEDEFDFVFENGEIRSIWGRAVPLRDADGGVRGVIGAFLDITERQAVLRQREQAEVALQTALQKLDFHVQNTPLAVIEWDQDLRVTRWSPACEHIFGWKAEEIIGQDLTHWQFVVEEDVERVNQVRRELLAGREPYIRCCNRNYTKDGRIVYLEWYNSNLVDESGKMVSVLSFGLDITERKLAEQERELLLERERESREQAEIANRIKDEFLAVLSHELRSPLNPILGWTKLLRTRKFDEQATYRALETIERNAKLQTQLIEDLLDISRILRGKMTLNTASVDLASTIEAALETVRLAAEAKEIEIQTTLSPEVGQVSGDAARLQQIIWNLLSNAIKFTPTGGQVEIQLAQIDQYAQICVRDTGKGINPAFLPYVFDYFRQEDGTTTRKFGGLGLGLAIVRHLTELHGGSVTAESQGEDQGARFTVRLPLLCEPPQVALDPGSSDDVFDFSHLRILVVDDEADIRDLLRVMLEQDQAAVQLAASAAEALQVVDTFQPDILISDIGMAEMDGYALVQQLRRHPSPSIANLPAIALTAYAGESDQQQALAAGFQLHLAKPIDPTELCKAIKNLTQSPC